MTSLELQQPELLWLALVIPVLVAWQLYRRRLALRHATAATVLARLGPGPWLPRRGGLILRTLALGLIVLALAGPRWPDLKTPVPAEGVAIMLTVDVSSSMGTPDFAWDGIPISRLEAVKRVFRLFINGGITPGGQAFEGRPTDQLGLITFATRFETVFPLTLSHSVLLEQIERERPLTDPRRSWTNLSDALALGVDRLAKAQPRRKVLVLLTDGIHNVTPPASGWSPRQAANVASSLAIPIHVIDAGTDSLLLSGEREGPASESAATALARRMEAMDMMKSIAQVTGGRYFRAGDVPALVEACQAIDQLERTEVQSFQYRRYHHGAPWLAAAAFCLFVLAASLEMTIWRRLP